MKLLNLPAFVALALVLSTSALPTVGNGAATDASSDEGLFGPLRHFYPGPVVYRPVGPVERAANDALGQVQALVASDVASTAGNIVGSVLHGILRREVENTALLPSTLADLTTPDDPAAADTEATGTLARRTVEKSLKRKKLKKAAAPPLAADDAAPSADAADATVDDAAYVAARNDEFLLPDFLRAIQRNPALLPALRQRLALKQAGSVPAKVAAPATDVGDAAADA